MKCGRAPPDRTVQSDQASLLQVIVLLEEVLSAKLQLPGWCPQVLLQHVHIISFSLDVIHQISPPAWCCLLHTWPLGRCSEAVKLQSFFSFHRDGQTVMFGQLGHVSRNKRFLSPCEAVAGVWKLTWTRWNFQRSSGQQTLNNHLVLLRPPPSWVSPGPPSWFLLFQCFSSSLPSFVIFPWCFSLLPADLLNKTGADWISVCSVSKCSLTSVCVTLME